MKFNVDLPDDMKEYLENQYKEYLKKRTMTKKEQRAVREWVKAGNSVYDNPAGAWLDGGVRMEYLDIYRDDEYIPRGCLLKKQRSLPWPTMAGMMILIWRLMRAKTHGMDSWTWILTQCHLLKQ